MKNIDWMNVFQNYYDFKFIDNQNFYVNPIYIGFKVTEACNQKCNHCWAGKSKKFFEYKEIIKAIKKISCLKPYMFAISGGEPFIRKDIFSIIEYSANEFSKIEILTNGVLLDLQKILNLKNTIRNTDLVHFSLDGIGSIYNKQRGCIQYDIAIENLKLLIKNDINTRVHMTVTPINVDDMLNVYNKVLEIGVRKFSINYVYPLRKGEKFFNTKNNLEVMKKYYSNILTIENLNVNKDLEFYYFLPLEIQSEGLVLNDKKDIYSKKILNFDILHWTIDADGNIFNFMDYVKGSDLKIGNIYKNDLDSIIKNNRIIQKKILFRNLYNESCSRCPLLHICRGGDFINSYPFINIKDKRYLIEAN